MKIEDTILRRKAEPKIIDFLFSFDKISFTKKASIPKVEIVLNIVMYAVT